jgi:aspartate/methionine/tyrosine aminotransferase
MALDTRYYHLRRENKFRIDVAEIKKLADAQTRMILINSPHNPLGSTVSDEEWDELHEFASVRGIQLVSDEVYHPFYHGKETRSATRLPHATVVGSFSKVYPFSGLRLGWIVEPDQQRREKFLNARSFFTISNNSAGEFLATIAMRNRETILKRTRQVASANLQALERFMTEHSEVLDWVRPTGGLTTFPWLRSGENARPFCEALVERGVLLAPGDCFDAPAHFRLGLGQAPERFAKGLDRFAEFLRVWESKAALAG